MAAPAVIVAGASHPYPGETYNGDAWCIHEWEGRSRLAVVDGLGHGPEAAAAAARALTTLAANPELDPAQALRACHQALHGSRGVAMTVALLDPGAARLTYAGIGNVEASLWVDNRPERFMIYRGIVGVTPHTVRQFTTPLEGAWRLLVYTDGVSARWDVTALPSAVQLDPQQLAEAVLIRWGRATDDATVVVACSPAERRPGR